MTLLIILGVGVAVLAFIGFAVHLFALWAGRRNWIYYKNNPRPPGSGPLGFVEQIYQPNIEHVIEERSSERGRASQDESGDKPDAGFTTKHGRTRG